MSKDSNLPVLLAGIGAGVAVALLLAPAGGEDLRRRLGTYLRRAATSLRDVEGSLKQKEDAAIKEVKDTLTADKVKDAAEAAKQGLKDAAHQTGEKISGLGQSLQNA